jgi:predicted Rossmann fold nucleotide-binding protein DprA/Smf involved in DNA uptake
MSLSLALLHASGCTHKDLRRIFSTHENFDEIFERWKKHGVSDTPWMTDERRQKIEKNLQNINPEKYAKIITENAIKIITENANRYSARLKNITQSPYVLYVRGNLMETSHMIGIV